MNLLRGLIIPILFVFAPICAFGTVLPSPFVVNQLLEIEGVVKDAANLKSSARPLAYEIPAYWQNGFDYVKYGIVCRLEGESTVIFADEGYLSPFVKNNVLDKPVLAKGKIVDAKRIAGLPHGPVFIIDSLRLEE